MITGNEPIATCFLRKLGEGQDDTRIATPSDLENKNIGHFIFGNKGLTIRQHFAATAPAEIPDWFIHTPNPAPIQPAGWADIKWEDEQTKDIVSSWHIDPCFDLGEEMHWYQEQWETYWEIKREYDLSEKEERYFQWRTYYADALINQLNK